MGLARSVERREAGRLGLGEARRPARGEGTGQAGCWARLAGSGPSQRGAASFVKQGDDCGQRAGAVGSNKEEGGAVNSEARPGAGVVLLACDDESEGGGAGTCSRRRGTAREWRQRRGSLVAELDAEAGGGLTPVARG